MVLQAVEASTSRTSTNTNTAGATKYRRLAYTPPSANPPQAHLSLFFPLLTHVENPRLRTCGFPDLEMSPV